MSAPILLVEDTASLSMLYKAVLTRAGHGVVCAYSLAEARVRYEDGAPRVVLLDLQLPDGDGLELLGRLRRESPDTRVIVITANGSINRAVQAMRAGAFDFLVKPFQVERVADTVRSVLSGVVPLQGGSAGFD